MGYFITNLSHNLLVKQFFVIGEHLPKSQAKWLIVSYASLTLDFRPQRCRTRRVSKITCVLRTETVTDCCYVNRQINVSLLSTNIKLRKTSFDLLTDWRHQWLAGCWACGILLQRHFICYNSCVQSIMGSLYGWRERLFLSESNQTNILKQFFEWLSLTRQSASITSRAWRFLNIDISQVSVATH